jgi:hypothetical protein
MIAQDGTMQLMQVVYTGGSYQIQPTSAPPDQVVYSPFQDYSCYVKINNHSPTDLALQTSEVSSGYYATKPPARIPADQTGEFWIEDFAGPAGSAGTATYISSGKPFAFSFSCPFLLSNTASGGGSFTCQLRESSLAERSLQSCSFRRLPTVRGIFHTQSRRSPALSKRTDDPLNFDSLSLQSSTL